MKFQKKMFDKIILASKSQVRKKILEENGINCIVEPSNIDEDLIKESLLKENATPKLISKNLAELKANKGLKTSNIPLVNENSIPELLKKKPKIACVVGLTSEAERLLDIRKNRMNTLQETENIDYTNFENISKEIEDAKKTFKKYKWPVIDVTRKSVEEIAASVIKIYEISKENV